MPFTFMSWSTEVNGRNSITKGARFTSMYLMSFSSSTLAVFRSTCPGPQLPEAVCVGVGVGVGVGVLYAVSVGVGEGLGVAVLVGEGAAVAVAAFGANSSSSPLQSSATSSIFAFSALSMDKDQRVFT